MARSADTVAIGYCHAVQVTAGFHHALLGLMLHDTKISRRVTSVLPRQSSVNISNARNWIVRQFLETTTADWLWMLDDDMTFEPDTLDALLTNAHTEKAPIIGGLCFGVNDGQLFTTLYDLTRDDDGRVCTVRYDTFPTDAMFQVAATGAACLLIHRDVLEKIGTRGGPYPWFQETDLNGEPCGEDVTFCLRAGQAGYPIWVNTGVEIGHQKTYVLTHAMYREQRGTQ